MQRVFAQRGCISERVTGFGREALNGRVDFRPTVTSRPNAEKSQCRRCIGPTSGGCLMGLTLLLFGTFGQATVDPSNFGVVANGVKDDSRAFSRALRQCSDSGESLVLSGGGVIRLTKEQFMWGGCNVLGDGTVTLLFDHINEKYLFNLGLAGRQIEAPPYTGRISGIRFEVHSRHLARLLYFWRTDGAEISGNHFDLREGLVSATSSGPDSAWSRSGPRSGIRRNLRIVGNDIVARAGAHGSEGIGLSHFDTVLIEGNMIEGVGDDPIALHVSENAVVRHNSVSSVDGRIFIGNSRNVSVTDNTHTRMKSLIDGEFYVGIALIYIGFESTRTNSYPAPQNITVRGNSLIYPPNSIDKGAAIYVYGPDGVRVESNYVRNDSRSNEASLIHVLPMRFKGPWINPQNGIESDVAEVRRLIVSDNHSLGGYPLVSKLTGNCTEYVGPVELSGSGFTSNPSPCKQTVTMSDPSE